MTKSARQINDRQRTILERARHRLRNAPPDPGHWDTCCSLFGTDITVARGLSTRTPPLVQMGTRPIRAPGFPDTRVCWITDDGQAVLTALEAAEQNGQPQ